MLKGILILIIILISNIGISQNFPTKIDQKKSVYDYALMLEIKESKKLNKVTKEIYRKYGIKVMIVSVKSLDGMDSGSYAKGLGEHWQLSKSEKQLLIVLKPKYEDEKGEIYILTTYGGVDSYIPNSIVKETLTNTIIPEFKNGNIYEGLENGIKKLFAVFE